MIKLEKRSGDPDQARWTNATCSVRFGELLPLVNKALATRQAAADAQRCRHRDVDQPEKNRLATLLSSQLNLQFLEAAKLKLPYVNVNVFSGSAENA